MKILPIGEQSFENLRVRDFVYIDKTKYIHRLLTTGAGYCFLSRPRRFGKSLLLSTIQAFFEGKKELFEGLHIYDKTDWEPHPVILLDMSLNSLSFQTMNEGLQAQLRGIASSHQLQIPFDDPATIFRELIRLLNKKNGRQVVVLIDEYDKPILDSISDLPKAQEVCSYLQSFYSILKSAAPSLRFVMLTGVSKISQTSVFSGLNNLSDITLNENYAGICGYTQQELEHELDGHITELALRHKKSKADVYQEVKKWYNGYSWDGETFVYNPFSVLKLLEEKKFSAHWFATGTPTFLIKLLRQRDDFSPVLKDKITVYEGFENTQTLENMETIPLFFQTGYLTIKRYSMTEGEYELQIPNEEVRKSLMETLIHHL